MKVGRLLLRAAVGGFFIGHGTQKLFGWFGGQGLKKQAEHFEGMGLKPGILHAGAAGAAETFGGAGVLLGYRTPLASASIVSVMLTAINRVHFKRGPWNHNGGYEYNVVLAAAAVALAESGPGRLSLDALRGKERAGAKWGYFSLLAGAAGAAGGHLLAESRATPTVAASDAGAAASASDNGGDPVAAGATDATYASDAAGDQAPAGEPSYQASYEATYEEHDGDAASEQAGSEASSSEV
ncbi:MAG: DoxX family protein [Acidobacteriota bacterium]|nr:DoxX family protein [Acidobacteriota bacterium]